jgi:hypothetical protein
LIKSDAIHASRPTADREHHQDAPGKKTMRNSWIVLIVGSPSVKRRGERGR